MQFNETWASSIQDERIYINPEDTPRIITVSPVYSQELNNDNHRQQQNQTLTLFQIQQMHAQEFMDIETSSDFFVFAIFTLAILIAVKFVLYYSEI